jgi:hypothetical protein
MERDHKPTNVVPFESLIVHFETLVSSRRFCLRMKKPKICQIPKKKISKSSDFYDKFEQVAKNIK